MAAQRLRRVACLGGAALIAGLTPLGGRSANPAPVTLRMGGVAAPPLLLPGTGEPLRGALRDFIMREIAPHTAIRFTWLPPLSNDESVLAMRNNTVDVMLVYMDRGDPSPDWRTLKSGYLPARLYLAVRPDSPLRELRSLDDLKGLKIGVSHRWAPPPYLRPIRVDWVTAFDKDWPITQLHNLHEGRVQAVLFWTQEVPRYVARKAGVPVRFVVLPPPAPEFRMTMRYSPKADPGAIAEFDRLATTAFSSDRFRKLLDNYKD